jgi:TPR repeat protein
MSSFEPGRPPTLPNRPEPGPRIAFWTYIAALAFVAVALWVTIKSTYWHESWARPQDPLQQAEVAFKKGDNANAVRLFRALANENNATAQYWLGHMTELGLGVPRDPAQALALYRKAADRNVTAASLRLGEIYLNGNLVPPDFAQARLYLERAAYSGNAKAAALLGKMYEQGLGSAPDSRKAYAWSEVATIEGDAAAQSTRDKSLSSLRPEEQGAGVASAAEILNAIRHGAAMVEGPGPNRAGTANRAVIIAPRGS